MHGRRTPRVALAIAALAIGAAPAAAIRASAPAGARPQLDVRSGQRTPVPAAVSGARRAFLSRLGIEAHLATDPVGGGVRVLDRTNGFLSGPQAGDPAAVALAWVRAHAAVFGLTAAQIDGLRLVDRTTSNDGVTHLTWVPVSDGVPAYDSELRVHVTRDGQVAAASGPPLGGLSIPSATPALSAPQALEVAQNDVGGSGGLPRPVTHAGAQRRTTFSNGDSARLVAFDAPSGDRLAWRVFVAGEGPYVYDELVDASTGAVLVRRNLTDFAVSNAQVYFYHPGSSADATTHTVDISRWLSPSATTLTGPNAHAYADPNDDGSSDGAPVDVGPSSGTDWSFRAQSVAPVSGQFCSSFTSVCTWNGTDLSTEPTNRSQATTQVFYYVNNYHDWLEQPDIGFTSSDHNFEGVDPVHAETDDGGGVDNANMSTLPDGSSPRMQMYLFKDVAGAPWPAVNGGDDASVVYHEYTHGLSNRLIDDANGLNENQGRAMGEGWSDWYAMDYLAASGLVSDTSADGEVRVGEYVTDDRVRGIRNQPLDCSVGSTAPACPGTATSHGPGGFTYADVGRVGSYNASTPRFEVHDDGEIWSETLWDLRKALGASTARRLITNAMRLSPAEPTFLDERDAILLADQIEGGASHDSIWQVFAGRGMGYGASTTSPNSTRAIPSFATPHLVEAGGTTLDDAAPLGDGNGVAEPGEVLRLGISLDNPGLVGLTNVRGTLSSATSGVSVLVPDAGYGAIAAGAGAQNATPFAIALAASVACGSQVPLTLRVTSDQGALDVPVVLSLGSGDSVFASTDPGLPRTIVDGSPTSTNAVSTLSVPTGGRIDDLRVTVNVTQSFVGDLRARLTAPSGQTIDLLERPGLSDDGFGTADHWNGPITFDDTAAQPIQEIARGSAAIALSGSYVPDEALAALAGQDRAGTWTLRMTDEATPDQGTLNGWSVDTAQPSCSAGLALPSATTGAASGVTATGATLGGAVDPGGAATTYRFDYGTTSAYGSSTAEASAGAGSGAAAQSAGVSGLAPKTTYHFRIVALRGGLALSYGADQTFATAAAATASTRLVAKPTHVTAKATLNAHDAFVYAFRATPRLHGSIRFTIPKHGRTKAISFGARSFVVAKNGRVKLTVKLGGRALAQLRRLHSAKLTVTIVLGGRTFRLTLKLTAPNPKRRR